MKKKIVLNICMAAMVTLLFVACKKDKTAPEATPNQEEAVNVATLEQEKLLLGQWNVVSRKETSVVDGKTESSEIYTGQAQDFVDFGRDNKVTTSLKGTIETKEYKLFPGNKLIIDGEPVGIETLTSNQCVLSSRKGDNNTYVEVIWELSR